MKRDNRSLSQRVAEPENQFGAIRPYLPIIVKMLREYEEAKMRVEEKKRRFRDKYNRREPVPLKLWAGSDDQVDIADMSLDEMMARMDE